MARDVVVPALGESITEATLGQWLKKPGDAVKADEPIASLETDKVAVEVPSPVAGVLSEHVVSEGDTVNVGAVIARIEEGASAATAATPAVEDRSAVGKAEAAAPPEPAAAPAESDVDPITLSPSVRRAVLEHGVDPSKINYVPFSGGGEALAAAPGEHERQARSRHEPAVRAEWPHRRDRVVDRRRGSAADDHLAVPGELSSDGHHAAHACDLHGQLRAAARPRTSRALPSLRQG